MEATFVKDSVQPLNRAFFTFNDKLYYWFFRPLSKGYETVVPEKARLGVRNFFTNVRTPGRFVNCVLQGKFKGAGSELLRLVINSTIGGAGFSDPASKYFKLDMYDEDFGQNLGTYNVGTGISRSFQDIADILQKELGTDLGTEYFTNPSVSTTSIALARSKFWGSLIKPINSSLE